MATTIANFNHEYLFNTLDTFNYTIQTAGTHRVAVKLTDINTLNGIQIVLKNNSSTLATLGSGITGNELNASAVVNCAVNDVIGVVVTSSTASDAGPNQFKGFITVTRIGA